MRVLLLQQRLAFNFQLHDAPLDFIDLHGQGIESACAFMQLEIERQSLLKEKTRNSKERRSQIEKELAVAQGRFERQKGALAGEKEAISKIRKLKEQIDQLKSEELKYERAGELAKVAEIRYGKMAAAERELNRQRNGSLRCRRALRCWKEEVDEEDIAKLVSK